MNRRFTVTALLVLLTIIIFSANKSSASENKPQVTFIELGSVRCIPCKMMQPVMDKIEKDYAGKVKIIFHDVWTTEGKPFGKKYNITSIPTQIFLDKAGNEFFRHTGFFAENQIVEVLKKQGVQK